MIIIALKRITRLTMLSQRLVFKFQLNGAAWVSALTGSQEIKYNVESESRFKLSTQQSSVKLGFQELAL